MIDGLCIRDTKTGSENPVVAVDAEQAQTDHEQTRHRAGTEGDLERRLEAALGRLSGADIRAHRYVHADESRGCRKHRANEEANRRSPAELVVEADQEKRDHRDDGDRRVLLAQIGARALLDGVRDLANPLCPGRLLEQPHDQSDSVADTGGRGYKREQHGMVLKEVHYPPALTRSAPKAVGAALLYHRRGSAKRLQPPPSRIGRAPSLPLSRLGAYPVRDARSKGLSRGCQELVSE